MTIRESARSGRSPRSNIFRVWNRTPSTAELTAQDAQYGMPLGAAELSAYVARARAGRQGVRSFRRDDLTAVQRVSAAALEWQLEDAIRMAGFADQRFVFDPGFRRLKLSATS